MVAFRFGQKRGFLKIHITLRDQIYLVREPPNHAADLDQVQAVEQLPIYKHQHFWIDPRRLELSNSYSTFFL